MTLFFFDTKTSESVWRLFTACDIKKSQTNNNIVYKKRYTIIHKPIKTSISIATIALRTNRSTGAVGNCF